MVNRESLLVSLSFALFPRVGHHILHKYSDLSKAFRVSSSVVRFDKNLPSRKTDKFKLPKQRSLLYALTGIVV